MNDGIWEIGEARLCSACHADMAPEYVFRCMGQMRSDVCERCGQQKAVTMFYRYTMNKAGLTRVDRLEG